LSYLPKVIPNHPESILNLAELIIKALSYSSNSYTLEKEFLSQCITFRKIQIPWNIYFTFFITLYFR